MPKCMFFWKEEYFDVDDDEMHSNGKLTLHDILQIYNLCINHIHYYRPIKKKVYTSTTMDANKESGGKHLAIHKCTTCLEVQALSTQLP